MLAKIEKKLAYWVTKPLSFASKIQIFSKVLVATHAYYFSCWAPSKASYRKLEKLLRDFLWVNGADHHGFHRVAYEYCCLPCDSGGIGLLSTQKQGIVICVKSVIKAILAMKLGKFCLKIVFL